MASARSGRGRWRALWQWSSGARCGREGGVEEWFGCHDQWQGWH